MLRTAVGAICFYESVAIFSRKVPTVSALCAKHKTLAVVTVVVVVVVMIVVVVVVPTGIKEMSSIRS